MVTVSKSNHFPQIVILGYNNPIVVTAASPYNYNFDAPKEKAATYLPENFPFAFPTYAYAGLPFALNE